MLRIFLFFALHLTIPGAASASTGIIKQTDAETHLTAWKLTQGGLELELIQRLPEQTLAFFQARGFSQPIAHHIGNSCVFQTIGKNIYTRAADESISIHLADWRVKVNGKKQSVKLKETWDKEWTDEQVEPSARLAFRWATFPTQQTFEPAGDYNWGMISFDLAPGSEFDLLVVWKQGKTLQQQWIKSLHCPENKPQDK